MTKREAVSRALSKGDRPPATICLAYAEFPPLPVSLAASGMEKLGKALKYYADEACVLSGNLGAGNGRGTLQQRAAWRSRNQSVNASR